MIANSNCFLSFVFLFDDHVYSSATTSIFFLADFFIFAAGDHIRLRCWPRVTKELLEFVRQEELRKILVAKDSGRT